MSLGPEPGALWSAADLNAAWTWKGITGEDLAEMPAPKPTPDTPLDPHERRVKRLGKHGRTTAPRHTWRAFDPATMPAIVKWAEEHVRQLNADAIVACGHSGLPIAGAVSYLTGVPVFAVRKPDDVPVAGTSSRVTAVAPNGPAQRWVWLDDFICHGGTFRNAVELLWEQDLIVNPWPVAALEYSATPRQISEMPMHLDCSKLHITRERFVDADWAHAPTLLNEIGYDHACL